MFQMFRQKRKRKRDRTFNFGKKDAQEFGKQRLQSLTKPRTRISLRE